MSFGKEQGWTNWRQVRDWLLANEFKALAKCMNMNNMWAGSVGWAGRAQCDICDCLRFAQDEAQALERAEALTEEYCSEGTEYEIQHSLGLTK